jgi:protein-L-isoaspartate O-methyltransferase
VSWLELAQRLAREVTHPASRWRPLVAAMPRHLFTPAWWERNSTGWSRRDAAADPAGPYLNQSLVTQVAACHADHARPGARAEGLPTSSATLPSLVVTMYRHAMIGDGMDVLDVGTGSGYGCALLAARLGDRHVSSVDVDPYLAAAAIERLAGVGLHPAVGIADATGPLVGEYDRIVSMMSVSPIPVSWLKALRLDGRLVTTIAGTCLIVTADRTPDGGAAGQAEWNQAGFMRSRTGPGYPPALATACPQAREGDGEQVTTGRYPVIDLGNTFELYSMVGVTMPGTEYDYEERDGQRTAWLLHPDDSWARATGSGSGLPEVHQAGPRRLWDELDAIRWQQVVDGRLPAYGAKVTIAPDGSITISRGRWSASIPAPGASPAPTGTLPE